MREICAFGVLALSVAAVATACSNSSAGAQAAAGCGGSVIVTGPAGSSKCGAAPHQVLNLKALAARIGSGTFHAVFFNVDAANAYFGYDSTLWSVPIAGGDATMLTHLSTDLQYRPVVIATDLIFPSSTGNGGDEVITSESIHGGAPVTLASVAGGTRGFAADSLNVYFIDQDGLKSVALAGGTVRLVSGAVTSSTANGTLAIVGSSAILGCCSVPLVGSTAGQVLSVPVDGGPLATLASGQPNAAFPLACGRDICWWTGPNTGGVAGTNGPGTVARLQPGGGFTSLPNAPSPAWGLLFDGTDFFETVGCDVCSGTVVRIPASGGAPVGLVEGLGEALDDECLYYSNPDGIFSVAKSYVPPGGGLTIPFLPVNDP
jgi:hypothetical protein